MSSGLRTWAISGGKDGVGKSFLSAALACALAAGGNRVVLVDADPIVASLPELFGISRPERTLRDFITGRVEEISDILVFAADKLNLICGAADFIEIADPESVNRQRLVEGVSTLDAHFLVVDMGVGAGQTNVDFFNSAERSVLVTTPAPPSVQSAYGFLKMATHRRMSDMFGNNPAINKEIISLVKGEVKTVSEFLNTIKKIDPGEAETMQRMLSDTAFRLIVNMAEPAEGEKAFKGLSGAAQEFLGVKLPLTGSLGSVETGMPMPLMFAGASDFSDAVNKIVASIDETARAEIVKAGEKRLHAQVAESATTAQSGLNEEIRYRSAVLHIQTEDLGKDKSKIRTLVFSGGRILFSRVSDYADFKEMGSVPDMLRRQHKIIIAGIKAGRLNDRMAIG